MHGFILFSVMQIWWFNCCCFFQLVNLKCIFVLSRTLLGYIVVAVNLSIPHGFSSNQMLCISFQVCMTYPQASGWYHDDRISLHIIYTTVQEIPLSSGFEVQTASDGPDYFLVLVWHYSDVKMSMMVSQITGVSTVCSTVCSGADQRKHQYYASLAFVKGIHQWLVDSPHKGPVTWIMFQFDGVTMSKPNHINMFMFITILLNSMSCFSLLELWKLTSK